MKNEDAQQAIERVRKIFKTGDVEKQVRKAIYKQMTINVSPYFDKLVAIILPGHTSQQSKADAISSMTNIASVSVMRHLRETDTQFPLRSWKRYVELVESSNPDLENLPKARTLLKKVKPLWEETAQWGGNVPIPRDFKDPGFLIRVCEELAGGVNQNDAQYPKNQDSLLRFARGFFGQGSIVSQPVLDGEWSGFCICEYVGHTDGHYVGLDKSTYSTKNGVIQFILENSGGDMDWNDIGTGVLVGDSFVGFTVCEPKMKIETPLGLNSFHLKLYRNQNWLEGFMTWHSVDRYPDVMISTRYISVRNGIDEYEIYAEQAKMKIEAIIAQGWPSNRSYQ